MSEHTVYVQVHEMADSVCRDKRVDGETAMLCDRQDDIKSLNAAEKYDQKYSISVSTSWSFDV